MLPWSSFKTLKDSNPTKDIFYTTEVHFRSNRPNQDDINRYYMYLELDGIKNECCIIHEDPISTDQTDFDNNYKSNAILF